MVNDNFLYQNMSSTEYDPDIFFFEKQLLFFWRHTFQHQNSHLWNTTVTSLEQIWLREPCCRGW